MIKEQELKHSSSLSRWRRAILGTLLVLAGLFTAILTILARRIAAPGLVSAGAIASLIFAALITILVVPPLARSAFAEIARTSLPFEVTTGGVIFFVILVVVGLAAWNTGNNLFFLVFSIMISTLFVSWLAARIALRELNVTAHFPDHIFAGEACGVLLTIRNLKWLWPSFSILVEARGPTENVSATHTSKNRFLKRTLGYFIYVPHGAGAEQIVQQIFSRRGHVLVTGFEVSTRFPFGFFRHRRRLKTRDVDIVVYPKPQPVADELHLLPLFSGQAASFRPGAGHDLLLLRDYQQRDEPRHIDWKATARTRRLTVREFAAEDDRRITIMLDNRRTEDIDRENFRIRFENGVIQAASLAQHFIDEGADVSLVLDDEVVPFGNGDAQLYACLRGLALIQPKEFVEKNSWPGVLTEGVGALGHPGHGNYSILLTARAQGSIPPELWRRAFVIYL